MWLKIQKVCAKAMSRAPDVPDGINRAIDEIGLSSRSRNALTKANINRVNDLVLKTEAELRGLRDLGKKLVNEIKQVLSTMGLRLAIPRRGRKLGSPPPP
jgi:DNA-directed RNA polymerase alpha subunit